MSKPDPYPELLPILVRPCPLKKASCSQAFISDSECDVNTGAVNAQEHGRNRFTRAATKACNAQKCGTSELLPILVRPRKVSEDAAFMDLDYFLQGSTPLIRSARICGLASPNAGSASQQQLRRSLTMATGKTPDTYASVLTSHRTPSDAPMDLSGPGASTDAHDQHVEVRASDTPSSAIDKDADWTTALTLRQRKQQALERKRANAAVQDASKTNSHSVPKKKKLYKLPPLPKDDFKIIIRPHQGLPLRNIVSPALAAAIIEACDHHITGEQLLLRIKPGSNIAILSTPHQEVAPKARGIQLLAINGHTHTVKVVIDAYAEVCPTTASAEKEGDACPPPWCGDFEHSYARGEPGGGRVLHDQP
ncbi:hypothetical protein HPB52_013498 [Rhipicephalus sanguineus]|uniref:Uncharacterized protein n=1 Tax=Rhipicephalus sanguineus TaxID=34632 RepID=A0A9D4PYU8_RHISA|nr:hypothetical protein HPB52_013498 [Rhipicephalus sanguineus]